MSEAENTYWTHHCQCSSCEEYRDQNQRKWDTAVIKAFVERVEKRLPDYNTGKGADSWLKAYRVAVMDELAEMEKGPGASHPPQDRPS